MTKKGMLIIVVSAVFIIAAGAGAILYMTSSPAKSEAHHEKSSEHIQYQCPMHPEIIQNRPGECPICGMDLVPVKDQGDHSSGINDEDGKKAPKPDERKILFYRNPMNPEITSQAPAKDEMGMDYIPVYSDEAAPGSSVKGLSPVSIDNEGLRQAGVKTAVAEYGGLSRAIRTYGFVVSDETKIVRVNTKISGWIEQLFVNFKYQSVKKGQPVLSIYSPELLASQKEYIEAIKTAAEISGPQAKSGASEIVKSARNRLELFDVPGEFIKRIEKTLKPQRSVTLVSPADGYVTAKDVVKGQRVEAGAEIFTLTDLSGIWIEAAIYSSEAPFIRIGQTAKIILPYAKGGSISSAISYIEPVLNAESRTIKVRFDVNTSAMNLKPGMFTDVILDVEPQEGVIIPESAIIDTGVRKIVYIQTSPGQFTPREVTTGLRSNNRAIIASGIAEGELVAVKGNFLLDSESRIRGAIASATEKKRQ